MEEHEAQWAERFLLLYESPPRARKRTPEFFPAHSAYADDFRRRRPGTLLMIGPFPEPDDGQPAAMSIFTSKEAAEEFAASDPFVINEVVTSWRIQSWLISP